MTEAPPTEAAQLVRQTALLLRLTPEELSDAEMVKLIRKHHHRADLFALLFERYEGRLWRFLSTMLPQAGDVEDVLQETGLRLYRHLDGYDARYRFSTWIYTIARRLAYSRLRSAKRRRKVEAPARGYGQDDDAHAPQALSPHAGPVTDLQRLELGERIHLALARLPLKAREVFTLYQFQRLSYQDIARIIKRPVGTVKSRMNLALRMLRESLHDLDPARRS